MPDVIQHHALIALIAIDPVGTLFGLAQRFSINLRKTRASRDLAIPSSGDNVAGQTPASASRSSSIGRLARYRH